MHALHSEELRIVFFFLVGVLFLLDLILLLAIYWESLALQQIRLACPLLPLSLLFEDIEALHSLDLLETADNEISLLVVAINFHI